MLFYIDICFTADKQLSNFLAEEIQIEKESQKNPKIPTIAGFSVTTDGAEVTLTKEGSSDERWAIINLQFVCFIDDILVAGKKQITTFISFLP